MRLYHFFLVFFISLLHVSMLGAQPVTKEVCLGCHSVPGLQKTRDGKTVSLQIDKDSFEKSIHRGFECTTCHSDISLVPHKSELKPVQCDTCHAASVKAYTESVHAKARARKALKSRQLARAVTAIPTSSSHGPSRTHPCIPKTSPKLVQFVTRIRNWRKSSAFRWSAQ